MGRLNWDKIVLLPWVIMEVLLAWEFTTDAEQDW